MRSLRHLSRRVAAAAAVVALSGCQATATTTIEVRSSTEAEVTGTLVLRNEAADALSDGSDFDVQLREVLSRSLGVTDAELSVKRADGEVMYSAPLDYARVVAAAGITGVQSAVVSPGPDGGAAVTVVVVDPGFLRQALIDAAAEQPDGEAVGAAMLATTRVAVAVRFAGGVDDARFTPSTGAARALDANGDTAVLTQALSHFEAGTFVATGDPAGPVLTVRRVLIGVAAAIGLFAAVRGWLARRRRLEQLAAVGWR